MNFDRTVDDIVNDMKGFIDRKDAKFLLELMKGKEVPINKNDVNLKIRDIVPGMHEASITCSVKRISNVREVNGDETVNLLVEDNTGEARLTMWEENTKLANKIDIGDIIKVENCHTKEGFDEKLELQLNDEGSFEIIEKRYEQNIKKIDDLKLNDEQVDIFAEIFGKSTVKQFESNGKQKRVINLLLRDETGLMPASLWNSHVDKVKSLSVGDYVILENAKVKEGYSTDLEVTIPWDSRIIENPTDESINKELYEEKPIELSEIEGKENVWVQGEVVKCGDLNTFTKKDGTMGMVRPLEIMGDGRTIKVKLWDKHATHEYDQGKVIFIQNGQVKDNYNNVELHLGWKSRVKEI